MFDKIVSVAAQGFLNPFPSNKDRIQNEKKGDCMPSFHRNGERKLGTGLFGTIRTTRAQRRRKGRRRE